jgi:hypothetical protein
MQNEVVFEIVTMILPKRSVISVDFDRGPGAGEGFVRLRTRILFMYDSTTDACSCGQVLDACYGMSNPSASKMSNFVKDVLYEV